MKNQSISFIYTLILFLLGSQAMSQTMVNIRAEAGIWYSVDWVRITYTDIDGNDQEIYREANIDLGEEATFTIPQGATNIRLSAKPLGSFGRTRIFDNLLLPSENNFCFRLSGTVNRPRHTSVSCGFEPRGRFTVFDTDLQRNIGLRNVKVQVKNKYGTSTIGTVYTDENGFFRLNQVVRDEVKYKVIFEDPEGLKVKWGANSHAESITFRRMTGDISHVFTRDNRIEWYKATIFNASQFYKVYADQEGIPYRRDAQVSVYYSDGRSRAPVTGVQDIVLRAYWRSSRGIFQEAMHEFAHLTHAEIDRNKYASFIASWGLVNKRTSSYGESWACGIEAIFDRRRYRPGEWELNVFQDRRLADYTYAAWDINGDHLYIDPIVIDLIDHNNQRVGRRNNELPNDRVGGYTIQQIAYALRGAGNAEEWKENLARINNPTNIYLDEYFNQFRDDRPVATANNTIIRVKAVAGIWYTVDWIQVDYVDHRGLNQTIRRNKNVSVGQQATITVPDGATSITIEGKPLGSLSSTRIFNNLALTSGQQHCIQLKGGVNSPRFEIVGCHEL